MSFTDRAGLFPVLLLTGCATPVVVTGPPAGSVVDSLLSRSAADISAMQYRIHQSGPSAKRPVTSATAKPLAKLPPASISTPALTSHKNELKPSAPMLGQGPGDGFIKQGGAAPTLRTAMRKIVPSDKKVLFEKSVASDTPQLWRWTGNDRWQYVANKMLASDGLHATFNAKANTVTVEPLLRAKKEQTKPQASSSPVPGPNPRKSKTPAVAGATVIPTTGHNPFKGNDSARNAVSVENVPAKPLLPPPTIKPVIIPKPKIWRAERGSTLKDTMFIWALEEKCLVGNNKTWSVQWLTEVNYRIDAPLSFTGSFKDALNGIFSLYGAASVPLYAGTRSSQCLLKVDDTEVQ